MTNSDERQLVLAAIDGAGDVPVPLVERLGDERALTVIAATTTVAVRHHFATEPGSDELQEFATSLREQFPDGAQLFTPGAAEAVIQGTFGHEEPLNNVHPDDIQAMLFVLPYAIMSRENLDDSAREEFVDETLKLVG